MITNPGFIVCLFVLDVRFVVHVVFFLHFICLYTALGGFVFSTIA